MIIPLALQENREMITFIECDCHSDEHTIKIERSMEDGQPEICISVQLSRTKGFFGRVIAATKYVFGHECRFGHWDCTSLNTEGQRQLASMLDEFLFPSAASALIDRMNDILKKSLRSGISTPETFEVLTKAKRAVRAMDNIGDQSGVAFEIARLQSEIAKVILNIK
jgi:hypothetical protein